MPAGLTACETTSLPFFATEPSRPKGLPIFAFVMNKGIVSIKILSLPIPVFVTNCGKPYRTWIRSDVSATIFVTKRGDRSVSKPAR